MNQQRRFMNQRCRFTNQHRRFNFIQSLDLFFPAHETFFKNDGKDNCMRIKQTNCIDISPKKGLFWQSFCLPK